MTQSSCDHRWVRVISDLISSVTNAERGAISMIPSEMLHRHMNGQCPGLECEYAWHTGGCGPMWQYCDAEGYEISGHLYAEDDAVERRRWDGPDGPDLIEYKRNGCWEPA